MQTNVLEYWKIQWIEYRIRLLLQMKKVHYLFYTGVRIY